MVTRSAPPLPSSRSLPNSAKRLGWVRSPGPSTVVEIAVFLFSEPDIQGDGRFRSSADGRTITPFVDNLGDDGGGSQVTSAMMNLLGGLQSFVSDQFPGADRAVIAEQLPWLHFEGNDNGSGVFTMYWHDRRTGAVQSRDFDIDGNFIGPGEIANSDEFFRSMGQQFIELALGDAAGSALAPVWAAQTAYAQAHRGYDEPVYGTAYDVDGNPYQVQIGVIHHGPPVDPYAGFTADQRAAQLGQLLASDPGNAQAGNAGHVNADSRQMAQPIFSTWTATASP